MGIFREMGRMFILIGVLFIAIGLLLFFGAKLPFRLGQLPGDIVHRTKNGLFYFPVVSCLVVSAVITLLAWLMSLIRK
ncbi:MAG: DUF2905 domain-containing protein [Acidobacteria bacterium]|nr:DUF2905 domain-containing protein [Acidobacteriota bacterium]